MIDFSGIPAGLRDLLFPENGQLLVPPGDFAQVPTGNVNPWFGGAGTAVGPTQSELIPWSPQDAAAEARNAAYGGMRGTGRRPEGWGDVGINPSASPFASMLQMAPAPDWSLPQMQPQGPAMAQAPQLPPAQEIPNRPIADPQAVSAYKMGSTSVPLFGEAPQGVPHGGNASTAIAGIESGGRYDAVGPRDPKSGEYPYGKYQVMGFNVGPWTEKYLGQRLTPQQFLASPEAQEKVFAGEFGRLEQKYGNRAASAWFAGEKGMNNPNAKDVLGTTVAGYQSKFDAAMPTDMSARGRQSQPSFSPAPQTEPDFGDRAKAATLGFIGNAHNGPLGMLLGAIGGGMTGQSGDPGQRAIYNAVLKETGDRNQAILAANNPEAAKFMLERIYGAKKPAGTMKIGGAEVPYTLGSDGVPNLILPPGMDVDQLRTLDADQKRQEAASTAKGKVQGEASAALPNTLDKADEALSLIDKVRNHPGRDRSVTGAFGSSPGFPGTKGRDFVTAVDQLKSKTFLEAYQMLKGGGNIATAEGEKAEKAIGRLDRAQTREAFDEALNDLESVIRKGRANAGVIAGGKATPAAPGWTTIAPGVRMKERQ